MGLEDTSAQKHLAENKNSLQKPRLLSPRQKGLRQGVVLMMAGIIGTPLIMFLSLEFGLKPTWTLFYAVLTLLGGLMRLGYALIFEESLAPQLQSDNFHQLSVQPAEKEIPLLNSHPVQPGAWMDDIDYPADDQKAARSQPKADKHQGS